MVVLELTQQNHQEWRKTISGGKPTLVLFYADWCGHCIRFKPDWQKICSDLSRYNQKINIAQASHDHFSLLPENLRVNGFPTIQILRNGVPIESYMGDRTREKIVKFAMNFLGEKPKPKPKAPVKKKVGVRIVKKKPALKDKKKRKA